jgi:hypothetical protein
MRRNAHGRVPWLAGGSGPAPDQPDGRGDDDGGGGDQGQQDRLGQELDADLARWIWLVPS